MKIILKLLFCFFLFNNINLSQSCGFGSDYTSISVQVHNTNLEIPYGQSHVSGTATVFYYDCEPNTSSDLFVFFDGSLISSYGNPNHIVFSATEPGQYNLYFVLRNLAGNTLDTENHIITVTQEDPPPPPPTLTVSISGPSHMGFKESGTFSANVSGGTGSYSYTWKRNGHVVSHSSSVNIGMGGSETDILVGLTVVSGTQTESASKTVYYQDGPIDPVANFGNDELAINKEVKNFLLNQNRPNPFNPSTKINYQLKEAEFVSVKVYNSIGKEVSVLVNQNQSAGSYSVDFNASNLPSGIYFYVMRAGDFTATKKMLLLK